MSDNEHKISQAEADEAAMKEHLERAMLYASELGHLLDINVGWGKLESQVEYLRPDDYKTPKHPAQIQLRRFD